MRGALRRVLSKNFGKFYISSKFHIRAKRGSNCSEILLQEPHPPLRGPPSPKGRGYVIIRSATLLQKTDETIE